MDRNNNNGDKLRKKIRLIVNEFDERLNAGYAMRAHDDEETKWKLHDPPLIQITMWDPTRGNVPVPSEISGNVSDPNKSLSGSRFVFSGLAFAYSRIPSVLHSQLQIFGPIIR